MATKIEAVEMSLESAAQAINAGLLFLAGRCNYATSWDGQGFSKSDAEFGHSLADRVEKTGTLSPRQMFFGRKLCWKYRKQLAEMGLPIPTPESLEVAEVGPKADDLRNVINAARAEVVG